MSSGTDQKLVAVVTGAGSRVRGGIGNGRAIAVTLARSGVRVALVDAVADWVAETQDMIESDGGESVPIVADVTSPASCASCVRTVMDRWGRVDILVNNVGVTGPRGTVVDVAVEEWDQCFATNVSSIMLMSKYSIPHMREQQSGSIINLASVAGLLGGHPSIAYPMTKGAVVSMTRAMAAHHGREGIRVNAVAPGMVHTPMVYSRDMSEETRELRRLASLLQTEGTAWDVAAGVCFLASDAARWITGVILPIDAGATAGQAQLPVPPSRPLRG